VLVLCCSVLCDAWCCAAPCCAAPCRAAPCCAVLCRAVPCCAVLCCAVLRCAVLCCAVNFVLCHLRASSPHHLNPNHNIRTSPFPNNAGEDNWWANNGGAQWKGGRDPTASINFVCAHDGFTLADLVAFNEKHNEVRGGGVGVGVWGWGGGRLLQLEFTWSIDAYLLQPCSLPQPSMLIPHPATPHTRNHRPMVRTTRTVRPTT